MGEHPPKTLLCGQVIIGSIIFLYGVLWVFDRLTEGPNAPPTP